MHDSNTLSKRNQNWRTFWKTETHQVTAVKIENLESNISSFVPYVYFYPPWKTLLFSVFTARVRRNVTLGTNELTHFSPVFHFKHKTSHFFCRAKQQNNLLVSTWKGKLGWNGLEGLSAFRRYHNDDAKRKTIVKMFFLFKKQHTWITWSSFS